MSDTSFRKGELCDPRLTARLVQGHSMGNFLGTSRSPPPTQTPNEVQLKRRPSFEEALSGPETFTPSPSSSKKPLLSSPKMASSPYRIDPATPQSSQSSVESGSPKRKKKKVKYTPQSNTLLNYFTEMPSKRSAVTSTPERPISSNYTRYSSEGTKHSQRGAKHSHESNRHSHKSSRHESRYPYEKSRHSYDSGKNIHEGTRHYTPRSPDRERPRSWQSSGTSPPSRYPAGHSRSPISPGWERHDRASAGPFEWSQRHSGCEDETGDLAEVHISSSQPSSDRTNKDLLRFRRFSGGSSSGSGNEKNKSFPIIKPLIQQGPSYDEILLMAKENVNKQKNERRADHHKSGMSSPGKLVHLHEIENQPKSNIDQTSSNSDGEKSAYKSQTKHRHSSGGELKPVSGRFLPGKSRHFSGSDKESRSRRESGGEKHLTFGFDRDKIYKDIMKRSPVVRVVKINTPSPVKITEELLKRCGSPGVLSDGGIGKESSSRKDSLKRHHSADDSESDTNPCSLYISTLKRQRVPSKPEIKKPPSEMKPPSQMEQDKSGSDSDNSLCSNPGEIAGPSQETTVTGVRRLFRELSTPSASNSDNADSGTEESRTISSKSKLKLADLHLDLNKLKNKIQLSPKMRKSTDEEPMDTGTDSDILGSDSRGATPVNQERLASPSALSGSPGAQGKVDMDETGACACAKPDGDEGRTLILDDGSLKNASRKEEEGTDEPDCDKHDQAPDANEPAASHMEDQSCPGGSSNRQDDEDAIKPRSLETLLANVENSQSEEEDLFASDDESDDDFLMAKPSALEEIVQLSTLPLPDTPEKGFSQISNDSLQSPCPTSTAQPRNEKSKKLKFTLDSMVDIKAKHEEDNADIPDLRGYIKNNMVGTKPEGELEDGDLTHLKANLQAKVDQYKIDNEQIPALHPGEDVFDSRKMGELFSFPSTLSLEDCGFNSLKANAMEKLLLSATPDEIIELINAQCLKEVYAAKPCPETVMLWLFQLMSIHPSVYVTQNCFQTLWYLLTSCLSIHPTADPWVPALRDVARVFLNYGSSLEVLLPATLVQPGFDMEDVRCVRGKENDAGNETDRRTNRAHHCRGNSVLPTVNVMEVIKIFTQVLITHGLKGRGTCYTPEELQCLLFLVCKTALDKQLIGFAVQVDFQLCISAILECFDDNIWDKQVTEVCQTLSQISQHHHNLVYVVQLMPTNSQRGRLMRRRLSYAMLERILSNMSFPSAIQFGENGLNVTEIKVSDLLPILHYCKPDAETDYYQLNSVITLIDLGVGNEPLKSLEKEDLERLIQKLRELTGDIKDGFRYMNRTQVKDLMLRTVNKMTVLSQSMVSRQARLDRFARLSRDRSRRLSTSSSSNEENPIPEMRNGRRQRKIARPNLARQLGNSIGSRDMSHSQECTAERVFHSIENISLESKVKLVQVQNGDPSSVGTVGTDNVISVRDEVPDGFCMKTGYRQQASGQAQSGGNCAMSREPWNHASVLFTCKKQKAHCGDDILESACDARSWSTQLSYSPHSDNTNTWITDCSQSEDLKLSLEKHLKAEASNDEEKMCDNVMVELGTLEKKVINSKGKSLHKLKQDHELENTENMSGGSSGKPESTWRSEESLSEIDTVKESLLVDTQYSLNIPSDNTQTTIECQTQVDVGVTSGIDSQNSSLFDPGIFSNEVQFIDNQSHADSDRTSPEDCHDTSQIDPDTHCDGAENADEKESLIDVVRNSEDAKGDGAKDGHNICSDEAENTNEKESFLDIVKNSEDKIVDCPKHDPNLYSVEAEMTNETESCTDAGKNSIDNFQESPKFDPDVFTGKEHSTYWDQSEDLGVEDLKGRLKLDPDLYSGEAESTDHQSDVDVDGKVHSDKESAASDKKQTVAKLANPLSKSGKDTAVTREDGQNSEVKCNNGLSSKMKSKISKCGTSKVEEESSQEHTQESYSDIFVNGTTQESGSQSQDTEWVLSPLRIKTPLPNPISQSHKSVSLRLQSCRYLPQISTGSHLGQEGTQESCSDIFMTEASQKSTSQSDGSLHFPFERSKVSKIDLAVLPGPASCKSLPSVQQNKMSPKRPSCANISDNLNSKKIRIESHSNRSQLEKPTFQLGQSSQHGKIVAKSSMSQSQKKPVFNLGQFAQQDKIADKSSLSRSHKPISLGQSAQQDKIIAIKNSAPQSQHDIFSGPSVQQAKIVSKSNTSQSQKKPVFYLGHFAQQDKMVAKSSMSQSQKKPVFYSGQFAEQDEIANKSSTSRSPKKPFSLGQCAQQDKVIAVKTSALQSQQHDAFSGPSVQQAKIASQSNTSQSQRPDVCLDQSAQQVKVASKTNKFQLQKPPDASSSPSGQQSKVASQSQKHVVYLISPVQQAQVSSHLNLSQSQKHVVYSGPSVQQAKIVSQSNTSQSQRPDVCLDQSAQQVKVPSKTNKFQLQKPPDAFSSPSGQQSKVASQSQKPVVYLISPVQQPQVSSHLNLSQSQKHEVFSGPSVQQAKIISQSNTSQSQRPDVCLGQSGQQVKVASKANKFQLQKPPDAHSGPYAQQGKVASQSQKPVVYLIPVQQAQVASHLNLSQSQNHDVFSVPSIQQAKIVSQRPDVCLDQSAQQVKVASETNQFKLQKPSDAHSGPSGQQGKIASQSQKPVVYLISPVQQAQVASHLNLSQSQKDVVSEQQVKIVSQSNTSQSSLSSDKCTKEAQGRN